MAEAKRVEIAVDQSWIPEMANDMGVYLTQHG